MGAKAYLFKQSVREASSSQQQSEVGVVQNCANKNWVDLVYTYNSTRAVSGASYEVFDAATGKSLKKGVLDNMGYARADGLPDSVRNVKFTFYDDPKPFEIKEDCKPQPHNLTPETKEIKDEDGKLMSIAKWVGTALAGDFAEDQSFGQIAFGTVVTMIPVVDQVADVRDIIANLHKLCWKKEYDKFEPWFSLVVTIIGAVPTVGSVAKGVCKIIYKLIKEGAKKLPLTRLIRLMNSVGEGNVIRFLREMADKLKGWGNDAAEKIVKLLDILKGKLEEARKWAFLKAEKMLDDALETIKIVSELAPKKAKEVIAFVLEPLQKALKDIGAFVMKGVTRAQNGARQLQEKFLRATGLQLRKMALRAGMKPEHVENLAKHCQKTGRMTVIRFTNEDSLSKQGKQFYFNGVKKDYLPKPLPVKLKTAKDGKHAGVVVYPQKPKDWDAKNPGKEWQPEQWELDNIEDLKKDGYFFDTQTGVLHDKNGNAFYGDYDVQSVHRRVEMENPNGTKEEVYLNELSNPDDEVSVIADMNRDVVGNKPPEKSPFQHGAEGDFRVKVDEKGKIIKVDEKGNISENGHKPIPVKAEELNTGGRNGGQMQAGKDYKLGRQHGDDEKYLIVDADGNVKIAENPAELKAEYDKAGLPWEYNSNPASAPASAAAAAGAK